MIKCLVSMRKGKVMNHEQLVVSSLSARELLNAYNLALVEIGPTCAATMPISEYIAMMKRFDELEKEVMFRLVG